MTRPSFRLRLALSWGALFLFTGSLLVGANHFLLRAQLDDDSTDARAEAFERVGLDPGDFDRGRRGSLGGRPPRSTPNGGLPDDDDHDELDHDDVGNLVVGNVPALDLVDSVRQDLVDETVERNLKQSGVIFAAMALVSLGLGWAMAGRMLRPIAQITSTARQLSQHNLHERVNLQGPDDELKEMADQFDVMLGRLEQAFDAQAAFVSNASHELRTPLTVIRTELEVTLGAPDPTAADLARARQVTISAIERGERLIDALLLLARPDSSVEMISIDLSATVEDVIAEVRPAATSAGVRIDSDLQSAPVQGSAALLRRVAENLIENGLAYNRPGGSISISVRTEGSAAVLRVENSGDPIDPAMIPPLFDRFVRGEKSRARNRGGAGLGLAIVSSVVDAHSGDLIAEPGSDGGLAVTVSLPRRG